LIGLASLFEDQIASRGAAPVLREVVPRLIAGVGGAAFHGILRTAYAARAADDREIAHGLAFWATHATPLRPLPPARPSGAPARELLERAARDPSLRAPAPGRLISDRMAAVVARSGFDEVVAALDPGPGALDDIADAVLSLYRGKPNFLALHTVTGTHALRVLLPYVGDRDRALRSHWQAVVATTLAIPEPRFAGEVREALPSWTEITSRALATDDEHEIKLADACREEDALRRWPAYREAAALELGMLH
jgi:hypothetical protein